MENLSWSQGCFRFPIEQSKLRRITCFLLWIRLVPLWTNWARWIHEDLISFSRTKQASSLESAIAVQQSCRRDWYVRFPLDYFKRQAYHWTNRKVLFTSLSFQTLSTCSHRNPLLKCRFWIKMQSLYVVCSWETLAINGWLSEQSCTKLG